MMTSLLAWIGDIAGDAVRWTTDAADDLEHICDYIARDRPAAGPWAKEITNAVGGLSTFPNRGRAGRVEGTRELALAPLPSNYFSINNFARG